MPIVSIGFFSLLWYDKKQFKRGNVCFDSWFGIAQSLLIGNTAPSVGNTASYDGNTVPYDGNTVPYDEEYSPF